MEKAERTYVTMFVDDRKLRADVSTIKKYTTFAMQINVNASMISIHADTIEQYEELAASILQSCQDCRLLLEGRRKLEESLTEAK